MAALRTSDPSTHQTPDWALAYLRGRARRFATLNERIDGLLTAIAFAQRNGATTEQVVSAVAQGGADAVAATQQLSGECRYHFS